MSPYFSRKFSTNSGETFPKYFLQIYFLHISGEEWGNKENHSPDSWGRNGEQWGIILQICGEGMGNDGDYSPKQWRIILQIRGAFPFLLFSFSQRKKRQILFIYIQA